MGSSATDSTPPATAQLSRPAFVGRQDELRNLRYALSQPPAVVLIEGEAGIGKSRLVHELLATTGTPAALVATCPPLREPFTLGPVVDALRHAIGGPGGLRLTALAGTLRPFFPEWADELPPAPEPLDDGAAARHRLFRAVAELLDALEVGLLVVEDAHWADDTTVEVLLFLLSRQQPTPSILVTYRPEDLPAGSALLRLTSRSPAGTTQLRLGLGSLDVEQTAELVSSMLQGDQVSTDFAAFLHQRTEGIPLAVEEVVRLMHDRADLTRRSGEWVRRKLDGIVVPPTVRDAVLERVARLGADPQTVLRAAAVLTDPSDEATLVAVSDLPADRALTGIDEAVDAGLLLADDRRLLRFRHMLACWAVYASMPGPGRRAMHRRAGEALERLTPLPVDRLARHFREAGELERWCRYAEQAADLADASGAATEAAALLHEVIVIARPPAPALVRLANKLPNVARQPLRDLVEVLRSTLSDDLDPPTRGEVRYELGRVLSRLQEYEAGRSELELALPDLGHDPYRAVRAMTLLGWPLDDVLPVSTHREWLRRAAEALPPYGTVERVQLDSDRACALLLIGDETGWAVAAGMPAGDDARQVLPSVAASHVNLSHLAMVWGRYREARRRSDLAAELSRAYELGDIGGMAAMNAAHLDLFTGSWRGLAELTEAVAADEMLPQMTRIEARLVRERLRQAVAPPTASDDRLVAVLEGTIRSGAVPETMEPAQRSPSTGSPPGRRPRRWRSRTGRWPPWHASRPGSGPPSSRRSGRMR